MKKEKVLDRKDFQLNDLPVNRKSLFKDILKNQFFNIIILGVYFLVGLLPLILFRYYNLIIVGNIIKENSSSIKEELLSSGLNYGIFSLFGIVFFGLVLSGILRIYKKMCFSEGYFIGADFIEGIRENIKDFLFISLIYGLINLLIECAKMYFLMSNSFVYYLLSVVNYVIIFPYIIVAFTMSTIYSDSIFKKMFKALQVFLKNLPIMLLITLIIEAPLLVLLLSNTFIQLFYPMIYSFIYLPTSALVSRLLLNYVFDKNINKYYFPELVNKGLYKKA